MKEKIINYFNDVVKEMKKVSWPTKDELRESTLIVVITCFIFSAFAWIVDQGLSLIFKGIF